MLNSNELVPTNEYYKVGNNDVGPILVELIDTPSFNPQQVVPFLEASLYTNLDKEILGNLANEPRKPVSTNPLLVASGASELNGNINGYFLSIVQFQARHLRDMMKIFQTLPAITRSVYYRLSKGH